MAFVKKVVASLPATLTPNTLYCVLVGFGFDLVLTDNTATPLPRSLNVGGAQTRYVEIGRGISSFTTDSRYWWAAHKFFNNSNLGLNADPMDGNKYGWAGKVAAFLEPGERVSNIKYLFGASRDSTQSEMSDYDIELFTYPVEIDDPYSNGRATIFNVNRVYDHPNRYTHPYREYVVNQSPVTETTAVMCGARLNTSDGSNFTSSPGAYFNVVLTIQS